MRAMLYKRFPWLVLLIGFASVSCTPFPMGRFVNNTDRPLTLEISWWAPRGAEGSYKEQLVLKPREARKCKLSTSLEFDVQGKGENGALLFTRHIAMTTQESFERYVPIGDGMFSSLEIYFLVTEDGIYPIPTQYRKNWKDHLETIVSGAPPSS